MNKWLRLVSISLVIFLLGSVAVLAAPEKVKIGFLVKMPEELWFQNEWKFAQQAADEYGFELIKIGTPDGPTTLTAIDNLAAQGAQGFVLHAGPTPRSSHHEQGQFLWHESLGC